MSLVIRGAQVLGAHGTFSSKDVLIEAGMISVVGEAVVADADARTIDATGQYLLPGLIDAHVHLTHGYDGSVTDSELSQGIRSTSQAMRALRAGITTVRELGSYRQADIALRNAIRAGHVPGPDMLCAGTYITITGGHGHPKGRAADGPDEVRRAVREQILAGADVIKIMCSGGAARPDESADAMQFTYEEIHAAAEEARFAGRPLAAHAHPAQSIKWALRAGARSIEHGTFLDEEAIDLMLESGAFLVPTLGVYRHIAHSGIWPELTERAHHLYETKLGTLQLAVSKGVPIAVGSDSSAFYPIEDFVGELTTLQEAAGWSAAAVIAAATSGNAELLGRPDRGAIEAGKRADLILLESDPLVDLSALGSVKATICEGTLYDWSVLPKPASCGGHPGSVKPCGF